MNNNLAEALEREHAATTLSFSKEIDKTYGDIKIMVPIDDAIDIYSDVKNELTDFTSSFESGFINRGLDYIENTIKPRGAECLMLAAHAANMLRELCARYTIHIPPWLPETFKIESENSTHQFKYLYKWSTVKATHIPHNLEGYLSLKLEGAISLSDTTKSSSTSMSNLSDVKSYNAKVIGASVSQSVVNSDKADRPQDVETASVTIDHKEVSHGQFVAKKYLWLMDSAAKRGMDFSISIEELSALLRDRRCYYTKQELVSFPHEKRENSDHLPSNYLTIDRKDNNQGYVSGNVVVCSKEINELKNQMSEKDFLQAIAFKTLVEQANLNPEQLNAFNVLMNNKT